MASDTDPAPDAGIIDALNTVYVPLLTLFEQAHCHEHIFECRYAYMGLRDQFDELVEEVRNWRRHVLNRVIRLGGSVDSRLNPIETSDDVGKAYTLMLDALRGIASAIKTAFVACKADMVAQKVLGHIACEVDCRIHEYLAYQRQITDLGPNDYLATLIAPRAGRPRRPTDLDYSPAFSQEN